MADKKVNITREELIDLLGLQTKQTLYADYIKKFDDLIEYIGPMRAYYTEADLDNKGKGSEAYSKLCEMLDRSYKVRDKMHQIYNCNMSIDDCGYIIDDNLELINSETTRIVSKSSTALKIEVPVPQMPITKDGLTIPFGPYGIQVHITKGYNISTYIIGRDPERKTNTSLKDNPHMAVKDQGLCYGDAARKAQKFYELKHIRPLIELATVVLSNYTTTGYRSFETYAPTYGIKGCRCPICREWINTGEGIECTKCQYIVCKKCIQVEENGCKFCGTDKKEGAKPICKKCIGNKYEKCEICGTLVCNHHNRIADIGWAQRACPDCIWECAECGLTFDIKVLPKPDGDPKDYRCAACKAIERIAV